MQAGTSTSAAAEPAARATDSSTTRILEALRRIMRAADVHSRKLAAEHDITAPQLACLLAVHEAGPLTSTDIARRVHLSASTVVGILDRLEEKQLIRRERDTLDRRLVNVTATRSGRALARNGPSLIQETLATEIENLSRQERTTVTRWLEWIAEIMEAQ